MSGHQPLAPHQRAVARRRTAFAKPFVWWVKEPLDVAAMQAAAAAFVGMKNFQSFAASDEDDAETTKSTIVLVDRLEIQVRGDLLLVIIQGSHFLWKMVRRIVGVLVAIGRGQLDAESASTMFTSKSDLPPTLTAPGSGLFLERVFYPGEPLEADVTVPTPLTAFGTASSASTTGAVPSAKQR